MLTPKHLAILLSLAVLSLSVGLVWAASDHGERACPAQSWDQKTGPSEIWWKAYTGCNDFPADLLQHQVYMQVWDWDEARWREMVIFSIFVSGADNASYLANSRYREVTPYLGIACYRVRVRHWVIEYEKGMQSKGDSYSLGQCY